METKTLFLTLLIVELSLGFFTWAIREKHYKAIEYWIVIDFMVAFGLVMLLLRGLIPDFFSIVIGNMALFVSFVIRYIGYKRIASSPLTRFEIIFGSLLFIVASGIHAVFSLWYDNMVYRMINYNLYLSVMSAAMGVFLIKQSAASLKKVYRLIAFTFFLFMLAYVLKTIGIFAVKGNTHFMQSNWFNWMPLLLQIILDIFWTISLLLIFAEMTMKSLKQREERYKTLSNLTSEGILIHRDGVVVDVNLAFCNITGYSAEELIGKNVMKMALKPEYMTKVLKALSERQISPYEVLGMRKNGTVFPVELEGRDDYFYNEKLRVVAVRDISVRKKQEEALKESEERFRVLFEQNGVGLATVDIDGHILSVNRKFCDTLGYTKEEILSKTALDITLPEDLEYEKAVFDELISGQKDDVVMQKRYLTKTNQLIWAYVHSHVIRKSTGEIDYIIGSMADITASIEAQQKIMEQNLMLTEKETELKAALEAQEMLLKEMHHRVKNNLQTISSFLNQQKNLSSDPKIAEALEESMNRVMSMALIHQFIYKSKDLKNINVKNYLNELVRKLSDSYNSRNNHIRITTDIEEIYFDIDKAIPLALTINEIFSNSFKYAFIGKDNGLIELSLKKSELGKNILQVADNGIGFPEDFDLDNSKSLGMYLIRNFVKRQLFGNLEIDSKPGMGVKMTIIF